MKRMLLAAADSLTVFGSGAALGQSQMMPHSVSSPPAGSEFRRGLADLDRRFAGGTNGCITDRGRSGHDGRRGIVRSNCGGDLLVSYYGGEWAAHNNRSWDSDSYNDWWHDRPDRAYPAWVRRNQDCQRPWFAGNTLTC